MPKFLRYVTVGDSTTYRFPDKFAVRLRIEPNANAQSGLYDGKWHSPPVTYKKGDELPWFRGDMVADLFFNGELIEEGAYWEEGIRMNHPDAMNNCDQVAWLLAVRIHDHSKGRIIKLTKELNAKTKPARKLARETARMEKEAKAKEAYTRLKAAGILGVKA